MEEAVAEAAVDLDSEFTLGDLHGRGVRARVQATGQGDADAAVGRPSKPGVSASTEEAQWYASDALVVRLGAGGGNTGNAGNTFPNNPPCY